MKFLLYDINICGIPKNLNISFFSYRLENLIHYLKELQADVVTLQEVNYTALKEFSIFGEKYNYNVYPCVKDNIENKIFVATMVKKNLSTYSSHLYKLPNSISNKDYYALITEVDKFCLINLHLHSGQKNKETRYLQLKSILDKVGRCVNKGILLCGDFNFDLNNYNSNEKKLLKDYELEDVWDKLNPNNVGHTQNPEKNLIRRIVSDNNTSRRIDGIFCNQIASKFVKEISICRRKFIISNNKIARINFSDHYGIKLICNG